MKNSILVQAVVTALLGMSASALAADTTTPATEVEKCYGVAKAGKNDCATAGGNACAAQVKQDRDPKAWVYLPKGVCDKIASGTLKP